MSDTAYLKRRKEVVAIQVVTIAREDFNAKGFLDSTDGFLGELTKVNDVLVVIRERNFTSHSEDWFTFVIKVHGVFLPLSSVGEMKAATNFEKISLRKNWNGRNSRGRKEEESTARFETDITLKLHRSNFLVNGEI